MKDIFIIDLYIKYNFEFFVVEFLLRIELINIFMENFFLEKLFIFLGILNFIF